VYLFDRAGVIGGKAFNYHTDPDRFCALILGLAEEKKIEKIGFDLSILKELRGPGSILGRKAVVELSNVYATSLIVSYFTHMTFLAEQ